MGAEHDAPSVKNTQWTNFCTTDQEIAFQIWRNGLVRILKVNTEAVIPGAAVSD